MKPIGLLGVMKKLGFLIFLLACGCQSFREQPAVPASADTQPHIFLLDTALFSSADLNSLASVRAFYARKDFALFWHDGGTLIAAADSLTDMLRDAKAFGLIDRDYHVKELETVLKDTVSADRFSKADVLLSDAYLTLYSHIRDGRLDPQTLMRRDLSRITDQAAIASLEILGSASIKKELQLIEPPAPQYHLLKAALKLLPISEPLDSVQGDKAVKIGLNMERWRWQAQWPDRYVVVNIPAFIMRVVEKDSLYLESKVIVGKRETPTPVLESVIRSFIIYPYWHAPRSISTKEILPELQADAAYLHRNNFEVLNKRGTVIDPDTIQWRLYSRDHFPYVLRQREGSENSMGIIKFNFANNYGVYLHDTNSRRLFGRSKRDLSHGCVRVHKAVGLAHYLVREDDVYVSPEDLDQYLSLQQRLKIDLRKPITLKLEYFTAEVRNAVPLFYDDIYKKDSVMIRSLYQAYDTLLPPANGTSL